MIQNEANILRLDLAFSNSEISKINNALITVPASFVNKLYKYTSLIQKNAVSPHGFQKGITPLSYIEANFKHDILDHVKEFIFKYFVTNFLYSELRNKKVVIAGHPRLIKIFLEPDRNAEFIFEFTPTVPISALENWKYIIYKAPKRKLYKDLDKQATLFINEETENRKSHEQKKEHPLEVGDWVNFDIFPLNSENEPIFDLKNNLWLKIGDDEPSLQFQEIFLGKKIGDKFCSVSSSLQECFHDQIYVRHNFCIEIKDIIFNSFFCIDYLKEHFKIKSNKNVHQKLIEVFSFRNDMSLRRAIVEDLFDLLFSKIPFDVPASAVLRQQQDILELLQYNPDYPVYKMQKGFNERVELLAKKQIKEAVLIDYLACSDDIFANHVDIRNYLNLANRPRTKDFIYFQHSAINANEQEYPIQAESLKQQCLREKTLNYVINRLTSN